MLICTYNYNDYSVGRLYQVQEVIKDEMWVKNEPQIFTDKAMKDLLRTDIRVIGLRLNSEGEVTPDEYTEIADEYEAFSPEEYRVIFNFIKGDKYVVVYAEDTLDLFDVETGRLCYKIPKLKYLDVSNTLLVRDNLWVYYRLDMNGFEGIVTYTLLDNGKFELLEETMLINVSDDDEYVPLPVDTAKAEYLFESLGITDIRPNYECPCLYKDKHLYRQYLDDSNVIYQVDNKTIIQKSDNKVLYKER